MRNIGEAAAKNVRVELVIPMGIGLLNRSKTCLKTKEGKSQGSEQCVGFVRAPGNPGRSGYRRNGDRFRIQIDCKDLQPGRRVWSDRFYIGAARTGDHAIQGHVFADNLPTPQEFTLTVRAEVEQTALTVEELCAK